MQTQIIAVIDTVAPEITLSEDMTLECPAEVPDLEGEFEVVDLSFVDLVLTTDTVFGICAGNHDVVQSVAATDAYTPPVWPPGRWLSETPMLPCSPRPKSN